MHYESYFKIGPWDFQDKTTTVTPNGNMYLAKSLFNIDDFSAYRGAASVFLPVRSLALLPALRRIDAVQPNTRADIDRVAVDDGGPAGIEPLDALNILLVGFATAERDLEPIEIACAAGTSEERRG
jgi:hypothetical protein